MNRLELVGTLVWPVEVRHEHQTGRSFARAMLAVSSGVGSLDFVPLTLWDREAEDAARYLGDGSLVAVEGHLHSRLLTDRDEHGRTHARRVLYVNVDRVTYLRVRAPQAEDRR